MYLTINIDVFNFCYQGEKTCASLLYFADLDKHVMEKEKDVNPDRYNFAEVDRAKLLSYDTFVTQTNQKVRVISLQYVYKILSS